MDGWLNKHKRYNIIKPSLKGKRRWLYFIVILSQIDISWFDFFTNLFSHHTTVVTRHCHYDFIIITRCSNDFIVAFFLGYIYIWQFLLTLSETLVCTYICKIRMTFYMYKNNTTYIITLSLGWIDFPCLLLC